MKLTKLTVQGFRSYRDAVSISFDNLTCLVGRNDAGKSSLLEALDLFFGEKAPDAGDFCVTAEQKVIEITCTFSDLPTNLVIDEANPTTLASEYLVNQSGQLEVVRTYTGTSKGKTFIQAWHPTNAGLSDLHELTIAELRKRAGTRGIDKSGIDGRLAAEIRKLIWASEPAMVFAQKRIPVDKNEIWTRVSEHLPMFVLFKSDRPSTDQDSEAQDPMKAAVGEAVRGMQSELDALVQKVEVEVLSVARRTLGKLNEMHPGLAKTIAPRFDKQKWEGVFKISLDSDDGVPMNKRGSGVRRLILINFFRAQAELKQEKDGKSSVIYAIEEPETSQHPAHQRVLLEALRDLAGPGGQQVIFTTHTPMLASLVDARELRHVRSDRGRREVLQVDSDDAKREVAADLGVLADNTVKLFICVEGKNDIDFLTRLSTILRRDGENVLDLRGMEDRGEVVFVPLGGGNLALWSSRLQRLNRREFHLYDRDDGQQQLDHEKAAADVSRRAGCVAFVTKKRESENYIHRDAISEEMRVDVEVGADTDVPVALAKALVGAAWDTKTVEYRREKEKKAKHALNTRVVERMSLARLAQVDPDGEVLLWFRKMKDLVDEHDKVGPISTAETNVVPPQRAAG